MIAAVMGVPVTLKVLLVLASFLLLYRLSHSLAASLGGGTLLLALWLGFSGQQALSMAAERLFSWNNGQLMMVIFLVIFLSRLMAATGTMNSLVKGVGEVFPPRAAVAALPAAIGLLPMPGGAIFSAPLIDQYDREQQLSGDLKTRINYWFRHIWEGWWPLYPGVILAVDLSGVPLPLFCALQAPLTLLALLSGYLFFLRRVKPSVSARRLSTDGETKTDGQTKTGGQLLPALLPIILVVVIYGLGRALVPAAGSYLFLIAGLLTACGYLQIRRPLSLKRLIREAFTWKALNMMVIVAVVRVYGAYVELPLPEGESVTALMRSELAAAGIPSLLLILLLPYLTGLATGISLGFVGASFPILLSLLGDPGSVGYVTGVLAAYLAGFAGVMTSPVHVCLVVTSKHYQTSFTKNLVVIGPVMLATAAAGFGYYALLRLAFGL